MAARSRTGTQTSSRHRPSGFSSQPNASPRSDSATVTVSPSNDAATSRVSSDRTVRLVIAPSWSSRRRRAPRRALAGRTAARRPVRDDGARDRRPGGPMDDHEAVIDVDHHARGLHRRSSRPLRRAAAVVPGRLQRALRRLLAGDRPRLGGRGRPRQRDLRPPLRARRRTTASTTAASVASPDPGARPARACPRSTAPSTPRSGACSTRR